MKKVLILCAATALVASAAFASGVDLSVGVCPGNTGVANTATMDCAGGGVLVLIGTFAPVEAFTDLVGADAIVDFGIEGGGNVTTNANFWDFQNVNSAAINGSQARPLSGCSGYTATWSPSGSGFSSAQVDLSTSHVRVGVIVFRPSNLSTTAGQKLFGFQLTVDGSTSVEAGGTAVGCPLPVSVVLNQMDIGTAANEPFTPLTSPNVYGNCVGVNGGTNCGAVPTSRHTWGQLKSLYR